VLTFITKQNYTRVLLNIIIIIIIVFWPNV